MIGVELPDEVVNLPTAFAQAGAATVVGSLWAMDDEKAALVVRKFYRNLRTEGRTPAQNAPVRTVFLIGPDKRIKLTLSYHMSTGRNFDEIIRVLDSIQLTAKHPVSPPANWKQGEDVILAGSVTNEQADKNFPGYKTVKPYLRTVAQPQ